MNYIIDANNLAGSLGVLENQDFDKRLILAIKEWLGNKQKQVVLVFDSLEAIGDSYSDGYLTVVYSPRDGHYKTADDKIVEIFSLWSAMRNNDSGTIKLNIIEKLKKDDLVFVSNDLDLKTKVAELSEEIREKIKILSNEEFMALLLKKDFVEEEKIDEDRGLSDEEIDGINDELLGLWK